MEPLFYTIVEYHRRKDEEVELIIEVGDKHEGTPDRKTIEDMLKPYKGEAEIEFFRYIPYAVLKTTTGNALRLRNDFLRQGYLLSTDGENAILDVDVSHPVFVPEVFTSAGLSKYETIDDIEALFNAAEFLTEHSWNEVITDQAEIKSELETYNTQKLWNLRNVTKYEAEKRFGQLGKGVEWAVIDTGCDYRHPEIRHAFNPAKLGYNYVMNNPNPMDGNKHGTHVAGTIAGVNVGVAPQTRLYAVKVLSDQGSGSEADVIRGIEWCIYNKVHGANLSLGAPAASAAFEAVCDAAEENGVLLVTAAGNSYAGNHYPASFDSTMSIAAVDRNRNHAEFSNISSKLDCSGPGVKVLSSIPGGGYAKYSGTSMATPHVSGVACAGAGKVVWKRNADFINEFRYLLKDNCHPCAGFNVPAFDKMVFGEGEADTYAFLEDIANGYFN